MKTFFDIYETDGKAEEQGIILDYGEAGRVRIARAGGQNAKYRKILETRLKPYRRQLDLGTLDPDIDRQIMISTFVDAVMIGWEGVRAKTGEPLEYTRENAINLFTALPDLFQDVYLQARNFSNFKALQNEEDLKN